MDRYLAIVAPVGFPTGLRPVLDAIQHEGLVVRANEPGLLVAASPNLAFHRPNAGEALLLGSVFETDGDGPIAPALLERTLAHCGQDTHALARRLWGDYVAFMPGRLDALATSSARPIRVLKAPFGRLAALHATRGECLLIASDPATLRLAGLPSPAIDIAALAHCIAYRELPGSRTCLEAVGSLSGGRYLEVDPARIRNGTGDAVREREAWSPWDAADRRHRVGDEDEARDLVRGAVLKAVKAQTGGADKRLLLLSGGIDSSILAASLGTLGRNYACFHFVRQAGAGDERIYARAVASRLGCELIEAEWRVEDVDVTRSHMARHPSPVGRSFMQGTNTLLSQIVHRTDADMTLDGGGGDNVFCALQSVAPVVDAWRYEGVAAAWRTAQSMATIAQTGLPEILRKAFARRFRGTAVRRWSADLRFLDPSAAADVPALTDHPWFMPPPGAGAGSAAHVAVIASAQGWAEQSDLISPVAHASPLATLPVVEACLRVPSWWWFRDGRNRMIARDAFAHRLPPAVIARRSKGAPDDYLAEIYETNRPRLRAMLLDGRLAGMGLLDRAALEPLLSSAAPVHDATFLRVLYLAEVEAWLTAQC